jgi:putative ABC transport system ATP-binding protein
VGASVVLAAVTKHYETAAGAVRAVDGVDLVVEAGTSLAIMGPSGCGKSTLLGLIGGLDVATSGSVSVGAREFSALSKEERDRVRRHEIGLVFQSDNLLPFLTVVENVTVQRRLDDPDADDDALSFELLEELGLAGEANKLPDQLSGGQRQRVSVARALVHRPGLIVADEPTGSLDAAAASTVLDLLLDARRSAGATLVLVTHDDGVARRLERTVTMLDGRLSDPTDQVRA